MFSRGNFPALVLSMALVVLADPNPTTAPGQVFKEGGTCEIDWTPDASGLWKTMNIQLMTGDNFHMVPLTSPSYSIFFSSDFWLTFALTFSTSCRHSRWYYIPWYIQLRLSYGKCRRACSQCDLIDLLFYLGHPPRTHLFLPVLVQRECD
jgi:hypothetical protein